MKKLFLIIYIFLIAFSSFASFEVYAQLNPTWPTSCALASKDCSYFSECEKNRTKTICCDEDQFKTTTNCTTPVANNQSNLSDYNFCEATIKNWTPPDICVPWESAFYGRSCNKCCDWITYDRYSNWDAKTCIECKKCSNLYNDVSDALAAMSEYANAQDQRPPQSELESFQWTIKIAYDKYKAKNCPEWFPNHDYSACSENQTTTTPTTTSSSTQVWISCTKDQLLYGQCKLNVYDTLGIRKSDGDTSVGIFVQDIVLSATMFIGTIVTIAIVVSGLMFVFGWANPELQSKAKKGLINAIIGLVIVMSSYFVIRLIQFIVKWE